MLLKNACANICFSEIFYFMCRFFKIVKLYIYIYIKMQYISTNFFFIFLVRHLFMIVNLCFYEPVLQKQQNRIPTFTYALATFCFQQDLSY